MNTNFIASATHTEKPLSKEQILDNEITYLKNSIKTQDKIIKQINTLKQTIINQYFEDQKQILVQKLHEPTPETLGQITTPINIYHKDNFPSYQSLTITSENTKLKHIIETNIINNQLHITHTHECLPRQLTCTNCKKRFWTTRIKNKTQTEGFFQHVKKCKPIKNPNEPAPYLQCDKCDYITQNKQTLKTHKRRKHVKISTKTTSSKRNPNDN